ncbi:MAG: DUF3352 domain-containing protein [Anaerolineae bacterium]
MKKLVVLVIAALVMLGLVVAPVLAVPTAELNALAKYFPADTQMFISLRIDDPYIATWDNLIQKVAASLPDADMPDHITDALDKGIDELLGKGNFQSEVRTWLGDVASIGVNSFEAMMPRSGSSSSEPPHMLFATPVKNEQAANDFWSAAFTKTSGSKYTSSTEGDFTVYASDDKEQAIVAIGKDVLFVALYKEDLPLTMPSSSLGDSADFKSTVALLPESDYNIALYADLGGYLSTVMEMSASMMGTANPMTGMMESMKDLYTNFPPMVMGFTVLDERSFTVDFALPYGDILDVVEKAGFPVAVQQPIDPAFASRIPGGIPFVIHSTDLGKSLNSFLKTLQLQGQMMAGAGTGTNVQDIEKGLAQAKFFIQGLTGLDLEKDIIPALEGDYALYVGLHPALSDVQNERDLMKQLPVDFAFMTEVTDPKVSAGLMQGIKMALASSKDVKVTDEKVAGTDSIVITAADRNAPFPLEFIVSASDDLFVIGTRRSVTTALRGDGGLPADPSFKEAAQYLVPSPSAVMYFASEGLRPLGKIMAMTGSRRDARQFEAVLQLISSASISASIRDNVSYGRFVWTLPQ